jgi:hypothetical protein
MNVAISRKNWQVSTHCNFTSFLILQIHIQKVNEKPQNWQCVKLYLYIISLVYQIYQLHALDMKVEGKFLVLLLISHPIIFFQSLQIHKSIATRWQFLLQQSWELVHQSPPGVQSLPSEIKRIYNFQFVLFYKVQNLLENGEAKTGNAK